MLVRLASAHVKVRPGGPGGRSVEYNVSGSKVMRTEGQKMLPAEPCADGDRNAELSNAK